jgi:two-component system sensor histidine kinase YesM
MAMHRFKDLKIGHKLIVSHFSIAFLSIAMITVIAYVSVTFFLHKNVSDYNIQIINQLNSNIEKNLQYMDNLSIFISYNEDINSYLKNINLMSIREKYNLDYKIQAFLINLSGFNPLVSGIYVFATRSQSRSTDIIRMDKEGEFKDVVFPDQEQWYLDLQRGKNYKTIFTAQAADKVAKYCVARKIADKDTGAIMGIVVISCGINTIRDLTKNFDLGPDSLIKILDAQKKQIFISNESNSNYRKFIPDHTGNYTAAIDGKKALVSCNISDYSKWMITCMVPVSYIDRDVTVILRILAIISVICLLVMVVLSQLIARGISRPIISLERKMEQVMKGNFDTRIDVDRTDEIGRLSATFNQMINKINELITTTYKLKIQEQEAELNALLAQINPHFLYNTLESIRTLAVLNDDYDVAKMITALGKFLRLKSNSESKMIPVGQEVEHAESYIALMQMKLKGKIRFKVAVDHEIDQYRIIKLTLQPLIENAIVHGLKSGELPGAIYLTGRRENGSAVLEIGDNGGGMAADALDRLMLQINTPGDEDHVSGSIGLKNVNTRLKLAFGEEFGLAIESVKGVGTKVMVRIPAVIWEG